ncbi:3-deoxy-D-manno-octulosonic-acid transferase [Maribacter vaceletii]|uniref:3-deoxy-D-manno-octulosonic acid transferase n=1 Tax=Maribacter vaceletii TaxID=1206816 RepID=A0A495EBG9_9FLAO|nr:glycosyltransferase N-terminal domain-containing protein [Maribacter vaceletii]RKR14176.1 3-deoxy-D-manno-octulosonic-acid transferase [Maribacter vaceletii]
MHFFYNIIVLLAGLLLRVIALFSPKIALFTQGRKNVFSILKKQLTSNDSVIWIHVASLGEFEQGLPIIEKLKESYPSYKILVTFFSPSGYEVKKNTKVADLVTYLPLDTKSNVMNFINATRPKLAIFVKYEVWPNYIRELHKREIPTILISAFFKKEQLYFKSYGDFMRNTLSKFTHIFVQDNNSKTLLDSINYCNTTISGDTRFDRVSEILQRDNTLNFMQNFKGNSKCFIAGSSWPEDEEIIVEYINKNESNLKYVIAPHNIKGEHINKLKKSILKKVVLYSEIEHTTINSYDVLLVDTIGLLTKIYSYADIAYVGGGFTTGLHNTLEPAVFGIPILIGPNYNGFKEVEDLVKQKGILPIINTLEFKEVMSLLLSDKKLFNETSVINKNYVINNTGASVQILDYLRKLL